MLIVKGKCFHFRKKVLLKLDSERRCICMENERVGSGKGEDGRLYFILDRHSHVSVTRGKVPGKSL